METENLQKSIYIVISQTGSILSRALKTITGAEYNHASISTSNDLEQMYSFGRIHPYNPFWGGFVKEAPYMGTFKRFADTKVIVMAMQISQETYCEIDQWLVKMYEHRKDYHYNYLGLFLAGLHIQRKKADCYYCSEFVKDLLIRFQINGAGELPLIIHPIHFEGLSDTRIVYRGRLSEYWANQLSSDSG